MGKIKKTTKKFLKQQQKMCPKKKKKLQLGKKIKKRGDVKDSKEKAKDMLKEKADASKKDMELAETAKQKASVDDLLDCDFFGESDSEKEGFRNLGDESASGGNASDDDDEEGETAAAATGTGKDTDDDSDYDAKEHHAELEALQESDPSFYKWLQENDDELLNFEDIDDGDEEGEGEGDEDGAKKRKKKGEESVLTRDRFEKLRTDAEEKKSFRAFRILLASFRSAVQLAAASIGKMDEKAPGKKVVVNKDNKAAKDKQRRETRAKVHEDLKEMQAKVLIDIPDEDVMHAVIEWMCRNVSALLEHHLGNRIKTKAKTHVLDISAYKYGKKCGRIGKAFWCEALFLMRKGHVDLKELALEACASEKMQRFLWPFAKIRDLVYKEVGVLWSLSSRHRVRLLAFLLLRNAVSFPAHVAHSGSCDAENIVRMACKMFAHAAEKGYTWRSVDGFRFLENGLVELLKTDENMAFRIGYANIRQLAFVLRNASHTATTKNKNAKEKKTATLYSWGFVRSIYCWTHIICSIEGLKKLAYPLMMVLTGAIKSQILSMHYFPYVYHCIRCLNTLGSRLEQYVPISSYVLRMLSNVAARFDKVHRNTRASEKALTRAGDVEVSLHFSDAQIDNKQTIDHVASMTMQLLVDHLGVLARTPAFPELVQPVLLHLRRICKNSYSETLRRDIKTLIASAESSVDFVRAARDPIGFNNDKFLVFDKVPLAELRSQWLDKRTRELAQRIASERHASGEKKTPQLEDGDQKDDVPETTQLSKRQEKRRRQKLKADVAGAMDGTLFKKQPQATNEDVVEQMTFSEDEGEGQPPKKRKIAADSARGTDAPTGALAATPTEAMKKKKKKHRALPEEGATQGAASGTDAPAGALQRKAMKKKKKKHHALSEEGATQGAASGTDAPAGALQRKAMTKKKKKHHALPDIKQVAADAPNAPVVGTVMKKKKKRARQGKTEEQIRKEQVTKGA